jgi:hypothetical protein
VPELFDLGKLVKGIVGLADLISRLAQSIEKAIKSGIRSVDVVRQARERTRLKNVLLLTAHLYQHQGRFVSSLAEFAEHGGEDRGTWEEAKFEILTISRLLGQIEKYVLPYSDELVVRHRKEYLELLTSLDKRRKLLDFVYNLEYEEALKNIRRLKVIGKAYEKLMGRLQEFVHEFGSLGVDDEKLWNEVTSAKHLQPLSKPKPTRGTTQKKRGS